MTLITEEIANTLRRGTLSDIENLFENHDLTVPDAVKQNAFFYLCLRTDEQLQNELEDICALLKDRGVDPTQIDANGQTSLFYACRDGNGMMVDFLMSCGVDIDHPDIVNGQTALFFASREGRVDVIHKMIAHGAKVDFVDRHQQTPLFYAASFGRDDSITALISHGADASLRDLQKRTPAWFARTNNFASAEAIIKTHLATTASNSTRVSQRSKQPRPSRAAALAATSSEGGAALDNFLSTSSRSATGGRGASSSVSGRPSSITMVGGGPAVATATAPAPRANRQSAAQQVPRYMCRIVCRPIGGVRWLVADDDSLAELENDICPELAQWTRTSQSTTYDSDFRTAWTRDARILLETIHKFEHSVAFHKPVDVAKMRCLNYYDVIKIPMDFSKIRARLKDGRYRAPQEFISDMALVFENCRRYNHATSEVAMAGVKTEERWELILRESSLPKLNAEYKEYETRKDVLYRARKGLWRAEDDPDEQAAITAQSMMKAARAASDIIDSAGFGESGAGGGIVGGVEDEIAGAEEELKDILSALPPPPVMISVAPANDATPLNALSGLKSEGASIVAAAPATSAEEVEENSANVVATASAGDGEISGAPSFPEDTMMKGDGSVAPETAPAAATNASLGLRALMFESDEESDLSDD